MTARMFNAPPAPKVQAPKSHTEWTKLMRLVVERAEALQHRHLPGLRASLAKGNAEKHLRTLGIISQADLDREFPLPK
jgi:hypothetical protein